MKKLLVGLCTVGLLASSLVHAVEHDWTNKQGKAIKAGFVSAGEEAVTISMGGKSYVVKLADLTPQSRALAAKLRVQKSKAREPQNDKTPLVKTSEVPKIDLDDNETRNKIIAEAISYLKIQRRLENGETASGTSKGNPSRGLLYTGNTRTGTRSLNAPSRTARGTVCGPHGTRPGRSIGKPPTRTATL